MPISVPKSSYAALAFTPSSLQPAFARKGVALSCCNPTFSSLPSIPFLSLRLSLSLSPSRISCCTFQRLSHVLLPIIRYRLDRPARRIWFRRWIRALSKRITNSFFPPQSTTNGTVLSGLVPLRVCSHSPTFPSSSYSNSSDYPLHCPQVHQVCDSDGRDCRGRMDCSSVS